MTKLDLKNTALGRRQFLETGGKIGLSGAAIALLSGVNTACAETPATNLQLETDVRILNTALSAEHEAVAAYQVGAESGLLTPGVLKVAVKFQGHHKEHIDLLASTVKKLGGTPTDAKQQYNFPVHLVHC